MSQPEFLIRQAESEQDIELARQLFEEYQAELGISLCFQNFDQELTNLPGDYAPPSGRLLLVDICGEACGCIALRKLDDATCEMKRLFLRPPARGKHVGRKLVELLIADAKTIGYTRMRLDTLPGKMDSAIALYRSVGFYEIPAYYRTPEACTLFMELKLKD